MVYVNLLASSGGADGGATIVPARVLQDGKYHLYIHSPNSHVYANGYEQTGDEFYVPYTDDSGQTPPTVFVYNNDMTYLLYTNQEVSYNQNNGNYEIYGYFPTTLKDCTVTISKTGWQTLQLSSDKLFN